MSALVMTVVVVWDMGGGKRWVFEGLASKNRAAAPEPLKLL